MSISSNNHHASELRRRFSSDPLEGIILFAVHIFQKFLINLTMLDIKEQMKAIEDLHSKWNQIKTDPNNKYDNPEEDNQSYQSYQHSSNAVPVSNTQTSQKSVIDFVSPMKRQLNALSKLNSRTNSSILDVESIVASEKNSGRLDNNNQNFTSENKSR